MNNNKNDANCQSTVYFVVYVIWCQKTNKYYVGVTSQKPVYTRIRQHKKRGDQFIDREIQKIGWDDNWDWWIVEENVPYNLITEREQFWVNEFNSKFPNGYNLTIGGISNTTVTEKTREKMRKSHLGKKCAPFTEEHRANLSKSLSGEKHPNFGKPAWNRGIPCTEDAKKQISKTLTGRKRPDQSERMKGENNPNFGKPMSESTKGKLRAKALERDVSGERNPMFGKTHTDEVKAAQSERMKGENNPNFGKSPANKGKKASPQTKAKISAAVSGEKNGFYGKHHSEATKQILREKALARAAAKKAAKEAAKDRD